MEMTNVTPGQVCSFEAPVSADAQHVYTVYAINGSGQGDPSDINVFIIYPAYSQRFDDKKSLMGYTIINDDPMTDTTWKWNNGQVFCYPDYHHDDVIDDWLITPPVHLEGGKYYKVYFTTYGGNEYSENSRISMWMGSEPKAESLTSPVIDTYILQRPNLRGAVLLKNYITAEEAGEYYFGAHAYAESNGESIYLDNLNISDPIEPNVPGPATDLVITPDKDGAKNGIVRFTVPSVGLDGKELTTDYRDKIEHVYLYIDGILFQDLGENEYGTRLAVPVTVETEGVHLFTVVCTNRRGTNNVGTGREVEDIAYFGINRPAAPNWVDAVETEEDGVVKITWEPSEVDYDGFPINQAHVTFDVFRYDPYDEEKPEKSLATGLTAHELTIRVQNAGAKQDFMIFGVRARTSFGGSPGRITSYINVGTPEKAPFVESFSNMKTNLVFATERVSDTGAAWGYNYVIQGWDDLAPVDNDRGFALMEVMFQEGSARLRSGKVDLSALEHPALTLYSYNFRDPADAERNVLKVQVREPQGDWVDVSSRVVNEITANQNGWFKQQIDLGDWAGKTIQIGLVGVAYSSYYTIIDRLDFCEWSDDNLEIYTVEAPAAAAPGREFAITAKTHNLGRTYAEDYVVELYRDGELIGTRDCGALPVDGIARVRFTDKLPVSAVGEHNYTAQVVYGGDTDAFGNTFTRLVTLNESQFPPVENLTGVQNQPAVVELAWTMPQLRTEPETVTDDFEDYTPWSRQETGIGDYTLVDKDAYPINGIMNGQQESLLPASVGPYTYQSYFVFDSTYGAFLDNIHYQPYSGGQCLMSMGNYQTYANSCSDWLISPVLSGREQKISFWAKSISEDYPENFRIHTNTEMEFTTLNTFTELDKVESLPTEWTKYEFTLPAGTQHFAIEHYGLNTWVMMLDDLTFERGGDERLQVNGFTIYRDGDLLGTSARMPSFMDTEVPDGNHTYNVTVNYNLGESQPATVSLDSSAVASMLGIKGAWGGKGEIRFTGEIAQADVYSVSGIHLYSLVSGEKSVSVTPGVYVVKIDGKTVKVTVK